MIDFPYCFPWFWFGFKRGHDPLIDLFTHELVPVTGVSSWGAGNMTFPSQVFATINNPDPIPANKSIYFYTKFQLGQATGLSEIVFGHYDATFSVFVVLEYMPGSGLVLYIKSDAGPWILETLLADGEAQIRGLNEVSFIYNNGHYKLYFNGSLFNEADKVDHGGISCNTGFSISPYVASTFDSILTIYDLKYGVEP